LNRKYRLLTIHKYRNQQFVEVDDNIAAEFPLTIFVNHQELVTLVCSPSGFSGISGRIPLERRINLRCIRYCSP